MIGAACALVLTLASVNAVAATVTVDPTQTWIGYMNVSELPSNGGAYDFGSAWATADLDANFSGPTLTLTPNDNIDLTNPSDPYWWQSGGSGAGNHIMAASMYVENDLLAGGVVDFTGLVLGNTLVSPYTSVAFIDDFSPSYSLVASTTVPLTAGVFNFNLATTAGDHIQYGFITTGPNARTAALPSLGEAQITAVPEPSTVAMALTGLLGLVAIARKRRV
jgi:hypothetical protein